LEKNRCKRKEKTDKMEEARGDQLRVRVGGNCDSKGGGGGGGGFVGSTTMGIAIGFVAAVGLGVMGKWVTKMTQRPKKKDPEVEVLEAVVRGDLARNPSRLGVQMLDLDPQLLNERNEIITKGDINENNNNEDLSLDAEIIGLSSLIVNHDGGATTNGYPKKNLAVEKSSDVQKARETTDGDDEKKPTKDDVVARTEEAAADTQPQALVNGFRYVTLFFLFHLLLFQCKFHKICSLCSFFLFHLHLSQCKFQVFPAKSEYDMNSFLSEVSHLLKDIVSCTHSCCHSSKDLV
jgi:hypothetical protein